MVLNSLDKRIKLNSLKNYLTILYWLEVIDIKSFIIADEYIDFCIWKQEIGKV